MTSCYIRYSAGLDMSRCGKRGPSKTLILDLEKESEEGFPRHFAWSSIS